MNSLIYIKKFLKFEKDMKLFEVNIAEVKIWNYIRDRVYNNVKIKLDNLSPVYTKNKVEKKIYFRWENFKNYFYINKLKKSDLLVLTHPRRIKQGDLYYCIYTDYLLKEIEKNNKYTFKVLEEPFWTNFPASKVGHFSPVPTNNLIYTDFIQIEADIKINIYKILYKRRVNQIRNQILKILNCVEKYFNVSIEDSLENFVDILLYVKVMKRKFRKILVKIAPKAILNFYCPSIPRLLLTEISNNLKIPSIDLQHGNIGISEPIHYKFYENKKYLCLPNYIFSFGEKFVNKQYLPTQSFKVIPCGYPFLELKKNEYENNIRKASKKYILFVSQGLLGEIMTNFASKLSGYLKKYPEYKIIYKLHPFERNRKYEVLEKDNIIVIDGNEHDIYYYAKDSYCQVGVYSTAVYECIQFNLPTFIINNVYGTEEAKALLGAEEGIYYVDSALECYNIILNGIRKPSSRLKDALWKKNSLNNMLNNIEKIIKKGGV